MKRSAICFFILVISCAGCCHIQDKIERGYEYIDTEKPYLSICVSFNPDKYKFHTIYPQFAVWLAYENDDGELAYETVFVTQGTGKNQWVKFGGKWVRRKEATPVWRYVKENEKNIDIDAVTGATPIGQLFTMYIPVPEKIKNKHIDVYTEVNVSFDYNFYYCFHPINGQPSVVWKAALNMDPLESGQVTDAEIVGHGNVWGSNTKLYDDVSHVTSAKKLLNFIKVSYFNGRTQNIGH
ncbi:MAG: hypothetical protein KJ737_17840 [Proteobacteria bacterium]|nr:hypothetical protein [Pseudomonadota bacterium]